MKNEEEPIKVNPKKNGKDVSNKNIDEENNTENKLIKTSLYESQKNILLKKWNGFKNILFNLKYIFIVVLIDLYVL